MSPAVVARRKAWGRASVETLGNGREARVHIRMCERVEMLLCGFVCVFEVVSDVLYGAIPSWVAATIHDVDAAKQKLKKVVGSGEIRSSGGALLVVGTLRSICSRRIMCPS